MKKNYLLLIILLCFFFTPKVVNAFHGSYSYDINSVSYGTTSYGTGVIIEGWAVLNGADGNLMHNISPKYTLIIEAKDKNGNTIRSYSYSNEKEGNLYWSQCKVDVINHTKYICQSNSTPYDYTKAYYNVGTEKKPYPSTTYSSERCNAMHYAGSGGSKFLINTSFLFVVPTITLKDLGTTENISKIYLYLNVKTRGAEPLPAIIYGTSCEVSPGTRSDVKIPLTLEEKSISDPSMLDDFNLSLKNTAKHVTVIVDNGYVQGNPNAFLSDNSYRLVYTGGTIGRDDGHTPNLYYKYNEKYTVVGVNKLIDMGAKQPYSYYQVKINARYTNGRYYAYDGGATYAYIPSFWANPTSIDGNPSYIEPKPKTCDARPECKIGQNNQVGSACPIKEKDPNCCSLCTNSSTRDDYKNTNFCQSKEKCGTCDVCQSSNPAYNTYKDTELCTEKCPITVNQCSARPECSTTNIDKSNSTCPANDPECCSLCTNSSTRDKYKDTDFCKSKCNISVNQCDARPECKIGQNNQVGSACPTGTLECCSLCTNSSTRDKYKDTDFCKSKCNISVNQCSARPECSTTNVDKPNSTCPTNDPECCSLCDQTEYKNTDFCKNPDKCGNDEDNDDDDDDPVPDNPCQNTSDPQAQYCCLHGSEDPDTCEIYAQKDNSNARKSKCSTNSIVDTFKYPVGGYGDNKFGNTACKISCEEIVKTTFNRSQYVKAGMGYEYPLKINGTRYCTAEYKNESWVSELVDAANNANAAYDKMKTALESARDDDNHCGFSVEQDAGTVCSNGEYLTSDGQCKRDIGFNACPNSHSQSELSEVTTTCGANGPSCECVTITKSRNKTSRWVINPTTHLRTEEIVYSDWVTNTNYFSTSRCSGSYENGSCYSSRSACPSRSSWNGTTCIKVMCTVNNSLYFEDEQTKINAHLNDASRWNQSYTANVSKFDKLMNDRSTCDYYANVNIYKGSNKLTTDYTEVNNNGRPDKIQVSNQTEYALTKSRISGTSPVSSQVQVPTTYNIKEEKSKILSINSTGVNNGTISAYSGSYSDYTDTSAVYNDFWNEISTADNTFEFSKFYYVQPYTGDISTAQKVGYENGNRFVYTDFYQISKIQKFSLNFDKIGPNLPLSQDNSMKIKPSSSKPNIFNCTYEVDNLIFPREGGKNYPLYGSVAFSFRQISLTDPFPNRDPRTNWIDKTIAGYEIYNNEPKYKYYLNPNCMQTIRIYNKNQSYNYGSFNINNPYKSDFLGEYDNQLISENSCR